MDVLLYPAEDPFNPQSPVKSIEIQYPSTRSWFSTGSKYVADLLVHRFNRCRVVFSRCFQSEFVAGKHRDLEQRDRRRVGITAVRNVSDDADAGRAWRC